jgi:hypothetical protein
MSSHFFGLLKKAEEPENKGIFRFLPEDERPARTRRAPIGPSFTPLRWRGLPGACGPAAGGALYGLPAASTLTGWPGLPVLGSPAACPARRWPRQTRSGLPHE